MNEWTCVRARHAMWIFVSVNDTHPHSQTTISKSTQFFFFFCRWEKFAQLNQWLNFNVKKNVYRIVRHNQKSNRVKYIVKFLVAINHIVDRITNRKSERKSQNWKSVDFSLTEKFPTDFWFGTFFHVNLMGWSLCTANE